MSARPELHELRRIMTTIRPTFPVDTPEARTSAYLSWRQEMLQANERTGHLDLSRAYFDAHAVHEPVTVEAIERELLRLYDHARFYEDGIRWRWAARRVIREKHGKPQDRMDRIRLKILGGDAVITSKVEALRDIRKQIAALNAEVDRLEQIRPASAVAIHAERVPQHVQLAAE